MKDQLKELIESLPKGKHPHVALKKLPALLDWVMSVSLASPDAKIKEHIYSALSGEGRVCECGRYRNFTYISLGYQCHITCHTTRAKVKATSIERFGTEYYAQTTEFKERTEATSIANWGTKHPSKSAAVKEKVIATNLLKYGVENVFQSESVKQQIKDTNMQTRGVEFVSQDPEVKKKVEATNVQRYGTKCSLQNEEVKKKTAQTNTVKFGNACASSSEIVKAKVKEAFSQNFENGHPLRDTAVREQIKQTNINRRGVENPFQCEVVKTQIKQTCQQKMGVDHPMKSASHRSKVNRTCVERYGFVNPLHSPAIKEKAKRTNQEKYGTDNHTQKHIPKESFDVLNNKELLETALKNNTFSSLGEKLGVNGSTVAKYAYSHDLECPHIASYAEVEISEFLTANAIKHERGNRTILKPKELDFYLPDHNLAIEFNGLYWHSNKFKDKDYHFNKTLACTEQGIQLLHIFEDEWRDKKEVLKKKILHLCGKTKKVIGARKLKISECSNQVVEQFMADNHMQGCPDSGTHYLKVTYGGNLVAAVVLKKTAVAGEIVMTRFCTDQQATYPGLMSKVVAFTKKTYHYNQIIAFADLRLSNGDVYRKSGWKEVGHVPPECYYIISDTRDCSEIERSPTELEMPHIYDCGKLQYMIEW